MAIQSGTSAFEFSKSSKRNAKAAWELKVRADLHSGLHHYRSIFSDWTFHVALVDTSVSNCGLNGGISCPIWIAR